MGHDLQTEGVVPAQPVVEMLFVAPASRLPMRSVDEVTMRSGGGIVGDRYENARHRHVTIQSCPQLLEAADVLGRPIDPALTRRNITVSAGVVPAQPGALLSIGEVEFEVVRVAAPCRLLDDQIGDGARAALRRRAGSVCRVLQGGVISLGDAVVGLQ